MRCASNLEPRTEYWHDLLVVIWHMLCKMAGHRCGKGFASTADKSEKPRPGVVINRLTENAMFDVRTAAGGDSAYCKQAALLPG